MFHAGGIMRLAGCLLAVVHVGSAQIMSVDLGHEFFKVALMRQGQQGIEILLNTHSKRKTTTAVSFFESVRTVGDDAMAHQGKAPTKVPVFFHSSLGKNYTAEDLQLGGRWWTDFGLGNRFYAHNLIMNETRNSPMFGTMGEPMEGEEVLAHLFFFCKKMAEEKVAEEANGGKVPTIRDVVVTVASDASLRQRQAVVAAGAIAGLRVVSLVHEGPAFAVQRAMDFVPKEGTGDLALYYNLGSRKAEVTIVKLEAAKTMVKDKFAPVVSVLGAAKDTRIGGKLMDIKIAEEMLKKFQEKHPKLAEGVTKSPRALRMLLNQAQKTKTVLSSNKQAAFIAESLYEDTDFMTNIERADFEAMCAEMFDALTSPIEKALASANASMADVKYVELIGGGWRVPKVQEVLREYIQNAKGEELKLGQHTNGEESGALGAALVAANSSQSFKTKKIFFSDITDHEYAVQVAALNGEWEKNFTVLYPKGAPMGGKKKLAVSLKEDFKVRLYEDGALITEYAITGLEELLDGKWKDLNATGIPKISATVPLELSGLIDLKNPTATIEEVYMVNVTKPRNKTKAKADALQNDSADAQANDSKAEGEEASTDAPEADAAKADDADAANGSGAANDTVEEEEPEIIQKEKKKKHEKKLTVVKTEHLPLPLDADRIQELKEKLVAVAAHEDEIQAAEGIKNEVEAAVYDSREKLEDEEIIKVSTEEQRAEISKMAMDLEEWMTEEGHSKADYESKLEALRSLLEPMKERATELEHRRDLPETVEERLENLRKIQAHVEQNMSWVNATKTEAAAEKIATFAAWWAKKQEKQAQAPLHEAPEYFVSEVQERLNKLDSEWSKLKATKKPKEKAKPKEKKASKAKATDPEAAAEEKLPEDLETAEKELASLREKKAAAVEAEDFDGAHTMKLREQALTKQIERLTAQKSEL